MAASGETAFRQVTDFGYSAGVVMSVVALSTGFLYSGVSCDMNLGEWNIVNGVLLATLAFICYFQLRISSKAMQLSYKLLSGDCSVQELLSEGVLPASLSVGRLLVPVLLLIWTIEGLLRARYGTCASTAPLLLGISLTEIVLQLACFISIAFYMVSTHSRICVYDEVSAAIGSVTRANVVETPRLPFTDYNQSTCYGSSFPFSCLRDASAI
ncbi:cation-transporting atpase [Cystoisospora suis]|uniref:Cation-transporting atpase n=1 Tax=Cystoisospora suis TaxID=483139 RepID=A0A2C6LC52_9APIC|nr:cation-transporting atpase [Cystoisospora suis]